MCSPITLSLLVFHYYFCRSIMNSLIITFDETKECLNKVSIQERKTPRGQKRARNENELPVWVSVFRRITHVAPSVKASPVSVKPSKKATPLGPWVSKYAQNPFGVHLKEHQDPKKAALTHLCITKEVQGVRRVQTIGNTFYPKASSSKIKTYMGKDLRQAIEKKKLQQKETIPGCTTWSPKPSKFKKKTC